MGRCLSYIRCRVRADILAWRKNDYQWDVLVEDKNKAMSRYRSIVIDNPSIDDILLLYVKGEQVK